MIDMNGTVRGLMAAMALSMGACDPGDDMPTSQGTAPNDEFRSAEAQAPESASDPTRVMAMGVADGESWAVLSDGEVKGWGKRYCDSQECQAPADNEALEVDDAAEEIHGNGQQVVVRQIDGTVLAYGDDLGQDPAHIGFGGTAAQLALGEDFLCARLDEGSVECRGLQGVPTPPWLAAFESPMEVVELAAGAHHLCARQQQGQVTCWGANDSGQLGAVSQPSVALDGPAHSIVAGGAHTCALLDGGLVQCWGANDENQLGHPGQGVGDVPVPEAVESIAAGAEHSCAIGADTGTLYCWGSDSLGQLGAGIDTSEGIRTVDLGGHQATAIFAGATAWTTFVVLDHGGLRGWGLDDRGQTGYGGPLHELSDQNSMNPGNLDDITIIIADDD